MSCKNIAVLIVSIFMFLTEIYICSMKLVFISIMLIKVIKDEKCLPKGLLCH